MGYIEDLRKLVGHKCIILNGSVVLIQNDKGAILLQKRTYPVNTWSLPGGLMELGESTAETAKREVLEETGLFVDKLQLLNVYSGKDHLCIAENGDEWYVVTTAYFTRDYFGNLSINDNESVDLKWIELENVPNETMSTHKLIISDYQKRTPYEAAN